MAKRSYPTSEVRAVTRGGIPHPRLEARGGGQEELPHTPTPEAKGIGREEQPQA